MNLCTSPVIQKAAPVKKSADSGHRDVRHPPSERLELEEESPAEGQWISPSRVLPERDAFRDPFSKCPESSFDCGSSVVSLDFGLVSPKKSWCSPPQRIERAQNREWSSPHRVIDRPNPENSPGNWVSVKESRPPLRHSPGSSRFAHRLLVAEKKPEAKDPATFVQRPSDPRCLSQATYVLQGKLDWPAMSARPVRKTSVLLDYEPERVVPAKKRVGASLDAVDGNLLPTNDKVRRIVGPDGHVIKISLLEDFEAPLLGKTYGNEKANEAAEKDAEQPKITKSSPGIKRKTKRLGRKGPTAKGPIKKKEEEEEKGGERTRFRGSHCTESKETEEEKENEDKENQKEEAEELNKNTRQVMMDLESILRGPKEREEEGAGEERGKAVGEKSKEHKPKKVLRPKVLEEEAAVAETPEKRKRCVDPKAVQEYIKNQKLKRLEQAKTEKKTKVAEKEARKKKLEELRVKTLKLAAQSKKKKPEKPSIKIIEPETEEDVTMSLGLKQTKPKVSYRELVLNMKKKTPNLKRQSSQTEIQLEDNVKPKEEEEREEEKEEKKEETLETPKIIQPEEKLELELLRKPEDTVELKTKNDLNATLKKLAETLNMKIEEREKHFRSRPMSLASKSTKDPLSQVPSRESVRSSQSEGERQVVTVDVETIHSLKEDIKKISENFRVLHEIIVDKTDLVEKSSAKQSKELLVTEEPPTRRSREEARGISDWLTSVVPRPHPYNVLTAFRQKMNINIRKNSPASSSESSTYAEPVSNKYDSDFEALSIPSDNLRSAKESLRSLKSTSGGDTSEENYYTMKEDSGSELSSSILDSDKQSLTSNKPESYPKSPARNNSAKSSVSSSIVTEITSRSIRLASSAGCESVCSRSLLSKFNTDRENLILVTPDIKLISNDLHQEKVNNVSKNNLYKSMQSLEPVVVEELNNSDTKSNRDQKSDSTITEIIDNLSEAEKLKSTNEKSQNSAVQRVEEVHMRRSFFQPEMLHLQFQAELNLLETFQESLSHFLEAERMKTLSEVNKIVGERAIVVRKEDQAVQTTFLKDSSDHSTSETESVKTEINISEEESVKTEKVEESVSEISRATSKESLDGKQTEQKELETLDFSNGHTGISFQMLSRLMKDEELRSEHQLALIRLREKTLNDKVKAELTFLEMKKRGLKERGGDVEHNVSAIKKKQRGILLKYQSEKEEIERLKKMHKIASEERKIMIKQQKQIQQMQMSTKDMIIKLRKREKSPQKRSPIKPKPLRSHDSQSSIQEDIPLPLSDSVLTESVVSSRRSNASEFDISSSTEGESEVLRRSGSVIDGKEAKSYENLRSKKSLLEVEKYPQKRHSIEELLSWTKRLEEKENRLRELEKQTVNAAKSARNRLTKSPKNSKTSTKDRSTSPFEFPDKTISEISPANEPTEPKKSSTISEAIETTSKTETTEKSESLPEKIQSSASEEIPEQFSKKIGTTSTSRTMEYNSESFESPSSSETPKTKPEVTRSKSGTDRSQKGVAIKLSLSPRMQSPRRRYSSGSDDSLNLSHTETASEQSDLESRIAALNEQLRKRKLEAERLRREQKKAQRERLKVKEQSLLKQIQAYDAYIQKKKQELEQEYEHSSQAVMKPLIKQPKVAEKSSLKRQELLLLGDGDKASFQLKPPPKNKEESSLSEKINESDSEILEQIKDASESLKEQIESNIEEEEESKDLESFVDQESVGKEASETIKSTSASESFPEQEDLEGSQSESEDQSTSIKTTLHSPEKPDTEKVDATTPATEDDSPNKETLEEEGYQFDSFESDFEDKISRVSESRKHSESSEVGTEIPSEVAMGEQSVAPEEAEEEEEEGEMQVAEEQEEEEKESVLVEESQESIPDASTGVPEEGEGKSEKSERIADSIILELILESVRMFSIKKVEEERKSAEEAKMSLEVLSSFLAREIISEAVDDMLSIYNRKAAPVAQERVTSEVRRRIKEIMSQAGGARDERRPLDIMITTYDVSPVGSPPGGESDAAEREEFLQSLSQRKNEEKPQDKIFPEGEGSHRGEPFGQEWFDDDFGLSRTRREAEELRLQQLQIEQEIQQLQAQQDHVPYFYLREIPNKPPPPYTPPGKPLAEVPTSEADLVAITSAAVRVLAKEMSRGKEVSDAEPTVDFYGNAASEHVRSYKLFLFDLAKRVIANVIEQQEEREEGEELPWTRTRERLSRYKYRKMERTLECLEGFVQRQVVGLFGFGKKAGKESLIVRWIKKKRDHVDEILVAESQEEESQWTQYDEDQVAVKNEVTLAILDALLEDAARVLGDIYTKKMKSAAV